MLPMTSESKFAAVVARAAAEPGFRGKLIWFPEKVIAEYGLEGEEARAARTADFSRVDMDQATLEKARIVFDLHDLHSGE
jgi:hypothetical protein